MFKSDENTSPGSKGLMLSWLAKSNTPNSKEKSTTAASSKTATTNDAKPLTKSVDTNSQTAAKSGLAKKKAPETKTSPKAAVEKKTTAADKPAKSKLKKIEYDDDDESEEEVDDDFEVSKKTAKSSKTTTVASKKADSSPAKARAGGKGAASREPKSSEEPKKVSKLGAEKKPGSQYYAAYMRREGPKNPGSKPVPIGKPGCFNNLKFCVTGVLDSLQRDECKSIVEKYGGSLVTGISKKVDYLIVGDEAGQSKISKAEELNLKQLSEDEFLQLICIKSNISKPKYEGDDEPMMTTGDDDDDRKAPEAIKESPAKKKATTPQKSPAKVVKKEPTTSSQESKFKKLKAAIESDEDEKPEPAKKPELAKQIEKKMDKLTVESKQIKSEPKAAESAQAATTVTAKPEPKGADENVETRLWVDKYKPTTLGKVIGQSADKSNASKLVFWLKSWQKWHGGSDESKGAKKPWNDQDTGSSFKAALLSGPPGIGKTTTAQLACKELGYTYVELNASDSRSKKLLDNVLGNSVTNVSIESYFGQKHKVSDVSKDKHCIIMDEVDGMAGNEDRGGIQELINTIKQSKIPIICICNDRQHVKIRSLANYCFDLRFYKPRLEQIRAALMSICFKEGVKITTELLDQVISGSNYDIRQCLYNLSMWSSNNKSMTATHKSQKDIESAMKDVRMNPFEACKLTFQYETPGTNKPKLSTMDRMDLFFCDYSLLPLLVQENYLHVKPTNLKASQSKSKRDCEYFSNLNETIESLCNADRVGRLLRTNNNWSLLPTQAVFTTLIPGEKLAGTIGLPAFPAWFGKNSKQGRVDRILQELQKHMRLHISANKIGVGLDYLPVLKSLLSKPLIKKGSDGIDQVIKIMNEYFLTREDFDTILELSTWPGQKDPMSLIDSKVKAAFTRTYNKESHMNPFCAVPVKKLKAASKTGEEYDEDLDEGGGEEDDQEPEDDDITADAMIKVKKKSAAATAAASSKPVKRGAASSSEAAKPTKRIKKS